MAAGLALCRAEIAERLVVEEGVGDEGQQVQADRRSTALISSPGRSADCEITR
jgi:hypothetical protein